MNKDLPTGHELQLYCDKIVIESENDTSLVTLSNIDLGEIVGQVKISDLLELIDESDVTSYYDTQRRDV